MPNKAECTCGAVWTGLSMAHCSVCHQTFSTVDNFDIHRQKLIAKICKDPAKCGMVKNDRDTWMMPGEKDMTRWTTKKT